MSRKIFLLICLLSLFCSAYSQINWVSSNTDWQQKAKEQNKLVLVDFMADWCAPCKKMEAESWNTPLVSELSKKFLAVKYDLNGGFHLAIPFSVNAIPVVIISDYDGEILYRSVGYLDRRAVEDLLASFPANVENIYRAKSLLKEDQKDQHRLFNLAVAYQKSAKELKGVAQYEFFSQSNKYFVLSKKNADKKDEVFQEKIELNLALNLLYENNVKSCIKKVEKKIGYENINIENKSLASFILAKAYQKEGKIEKSREYFKNIKRGKLDNMLIEELADSLNR